jgi:hypothetical protein
LRSGSNSFDQLSHDFAISNHARYSRTSRSFVT